MAGFVILPLFNSRDELAQLSRNAFDITWLPEDRRQHYFDQFQTYANT
jgi:hypothetical protein